MAQQQGGDLSMGGAFAPGEHLLLLTASSGDSAFHFPATEYPTGQQATFQLELASSLLRNRPGMISSKLVSLPEAGSVLIASCP